MYPKWSDWNIQYTAKGLFKERIKQTLRVLTLLASIAGLYYIRKNPIGGLRVFDSWMKQKVKLGLLRVLGWMEKGVRMLPEQNRAL